MILTCPSCSSISWQSFSWTSGFIAIEWAKNESVDAVVSKPARKKIIHWAIISRSLRPVKEKGNQLKHKRKRCWKWNNSTGKGISLTRFLGYKTRSRHLTRSRERERHGWTALQYGTRLWFWVSQLRINCSYFLYRIDKT